MMPSNRRFRYKFATMCILTPAILATSGNCPGNPLAPLTRSGDFTPRRVSDTYQYKFEVGADPNKNVTAQFIVTCPSFCAEIKPADVLVELTLNCSIGEIRFPVTLTNDGLTKLTGSFTRSASNECEDLSMLPLPANWSVALTRIGTPDISFHWDAQFFQYHRP